MKKLAKFSLFDVLNTTFLLLLSITMLYPFLNVLALSLNEAMDAQRGGIYLIPRVFTFDSYYFIFQTASLVNSAIVTLARTIIGTAVTVLLSAMFAYTFTKRDFAIYKPMKAIFMIAMFFGGGGLIPRYMLYNDLHLINNFLVYILPSAINLFFVMILRSYFLQLPYGLTESAMLDGANELLIFFRIVIPLSAPIIAYVTLNVAVSQWNSWQDTLFFTSGGNLKTLQYQMMEVMLKSEARLVISRAMMNLKKIGIQNTVSSKSVQMAITILVTVPIVMVYPFLQKYFIKGILIGSMKG